MRTTGKNPDMPSEAHPLRLYKIEKLCSTTAIEQLFSRIGDRTYGTLVYPLRVVWRYNDTRNADIPVQFLISVPKRRLRHAVDRVTMRRRIREAYRLNRTILDLPDDTRLDIAFVYIGKGLEKSPVVHHAMQRALARLSKIIIHSSM